MGRRRDLFGMIPQAAEEAGTDTLGAKGARWLLQPTGLQQDDEAVRAAAETLQHSFLTLRKQQQVS